MKATNEQKVINEILAFGLNNFKRIDSKHASDLHHELFNMEYFNKYVNDENDTLSMYGELKAVGKVYKYEKEQFGEVTTDLSEAHKVLNMLAYVIGEEILQECETLKNKWDEELTEKDLKQIAKEMKIAAKNI